GRAEERCYEIAHFGVEFARGAQSKQPHRARKARRRFVGRRLAIEYCPLPLIEMSVGQEGRGYSEARGNIDIAMRIVAVMMHCVCSDFFRLEHLPIERARSLGAAKCAGNVNTVSVRGSAVPP